MTTTFHCTSIEDYGNGRMAIVRGCLMSGAIAPGMQIHIGLNDTFDMTVPIAEVRHSEELLVDCDDQEGVDMLLAFDVASEDLRIR